jgi:FtsZ-binding cell division protein ZapB
MTKSITEDSLKRILDDKFRPVEDKVKELVKTVEFISAKYDELLSKQINIEAVSNALVKENEILKSQVSNLQNRVEQLSTNVNDLEQYGRRECLEIRGVPFRDDEDLTNVAYALLGRGLLAKIISLRGTHVGNTWFGVYLKGI